MQSIMTPSAQILLLYIYKKTGISRISILITGPAIKQLIRMFVFVMKYGCYGRAGKYRQMARPLKWYHARVVRRLSRPLLFRRLIDQMFCFAIIRACLFPESITTCMKFSSSYLFVTLRLCDTAVKLQIDFSCLYAALKRNWFASH